MKYHWIKEYKESTRKGERKIYSEREKEKNKACTSMSIRKSKESNLRTNI